jgi:hypothetical protein
MRGASENGENAGSHPDPRPHTCQPSALPRVLVTKDRVLGHAPALALHTAGSYYPWLKEPF